jgi:hypothetical protein
MATYRVSFLNSAGAVVGERVFTAPTNFDAIQTAKQMADRAQCVGFELSSKRRTITRQRRDGIEKRAERPC